MTGRTTGQLGGRPNLAFDHEFPPLFLLIGPWFPIHRKNFFEGAKIWRGVSVTVQAPLHQQRARLENQRHLVDLSVTSRATNALVNVNAVVEIHKIRQPVDLDPLNGFVGAIAFAHRFEITRGVEQHGVAVHAGLGWRDSRNGGSFHTRVAVAAIDAVVSHMMLVAELHRLLSRDVLARPVRRARHGENGEQRQAQQKQRREHTESRDVVGAAMKNLRHVRFALWRGSAPEGR